MEIVENLDQWLAEFEDGWLKHLNETGEKNWRIYNLPRNSIAPSGPAVVLKQSRLMLISSAGAYLASDQEPFDDADLLGDYSIRLFPADTAPEQIAFAHPSYDHTAVDEDQQVLLPTAHLRDLVAEGVIGGLTPSVVSFMGYQPVVTRLVDETIPAILEVAQAEQPDAVLLVPS